MRSAFGVEHIAKMGQAHLDAVREAAIAARRLHVTGTPPGQSLPQHMPVYLAGRRKVEDAIRSADAAGHSIEEIRAAGVHGGFTSKQAIHRALGLPHPFRKPRQGRLL